LPPAIARVVALGAPLRSGGRVWLY